MGELWLRSTNILFENQLPYFLVPKINIKQEWCLPMCSLSDRKTKLEAIYFLFRHGRISNFSCGTSQMKPEKVHDRKYPPYNFL